MIQFKMPPPTGPDWPPVVRAGDYDPHGPPAPIIVLWYDLHRRPFSWVASIHRLVDSRVWTLHQQGRTEAEAVTRLKSHPKFADMILPAAGPVWSEVYQKSLILSHEEQPTNAADQKIQ